MAPCNPTAGEHSGRPPPRPHLRFAAAPAGGGLPGTAHDDDAFRITHWVAHGFAATLAVLSAWAAYSLGAAAHHEADAAAEVLLSEPVDFTLVISPTPGPAELTEFEPGEPTLPLPGPRPDAREALATQLADEMDAIAMRQALLDRHRLAIPTSPPSDRDLREELERLNERLVQDLPTAAAGAAIRPR